MKVYLLVVANTNTGHLRHPILEYKTSTRVTNWNNFSSKIEKHLKESDECKFMCIKLMNKKQQRKLPTYSLMRIELHYHYLKQHNETPPK